MLTKVLFAGNMLINSLSRLIDRNNVNMNWIIAGEGNFFLNLINKTKLKTMIKLYPAISVC